MASRYLCGLTVPRKQHMLYELRELQRSFLDPLSDWAEMSAKLYADPKSPFAYAPFAKSFAAGLELVHRLGKDYDKPSWNIPTVSVAGKNITVQESVFEEKAFCRLVHFKKMTEKTSKAKEPVVLVFAPLSGHHATLLRDTVRTLVADHEVYITDWIDARQVPLTEGPFHLDDYIAYCIQFMRALQKKHGKIHAVSVCQPTVPVLAALSVMAALGETLPVTATMMGGPIDTSKSPTEVNNLATEHTYDWFARNLVYRVPVNHKGAGRMVYPGFLQHAGFVAMNPDRHMKSHWEFYKDLVRGDLNDAEFHRDFYNEYNAVLDLPAEYYLETVKTVFQDQALPKGTWDVKFEGKTHRVDPSKIRALRLLTVEGELDDISGQGQTKAALDLCSNIKQQHKQHLTVQGAGHYGIFSGRRWREQVYPQISRFIRAA
jgi:poly(3-hydroxybutyrate) depolymerase